MERVQEQNHIADEFLELRAALIQLAKALETERACVLRILKIIERKTEVNIEDIKVVV